MRVQSRLAPVVDELKAKRGDASRTFHFLTERARFVPRPDDVYVATYPRSGTTWLQYVCHLLLHEGALDTPARTPAFEHISDVAPWFERTLARKLRRARDFEALASPRVFKTHLPRAWLPGPGRFLYATREPEDVVVSYWNLYRTHLGYEGDLDAFFERYLRGEVQYGARAKHVEGWQRAARRDRSILLVRYEDLHRRPREEVARLARFLDSPLDEAQLDEVVARSGFEVMKAHQTRFDHATEERRGEGRAGFVRAGRVGEGRAALSAEQRRRLADQRPPRWAELELDLPAFLH